MVVPLLGWLVAAALSAARGVAAPPEAGILLSAPRPVVAGVLRAEYQANVQDGSVIHAPGIVVGPGAGVVLGAASLWRTRDTAPGMNEGFVLRAYEVGWWAWDAERGPPADLGLAVSYTDSVFERRRDGLRILRTGERTLGGAIRAARAIGWFEPGLGLQWSSRFFKVRRIRLDYLSTAASLRVRLGPLPAEVFGEWLPWIANPDRLPVPWSAGLSLGPVRNSLVTLFVTNTYGSAMPTVLSAVPDTLWGARLSVSWALLPSAD